MYLNRTGIVFGYKDAWNVDMTLSPIIAKCIRKYMEPSESDYFGYPEGLTPEKWLVILEKICYAFESKEPEMPDGTLQMRRSTANKQGHIPCTVEIVDQETYDRVTKETEEWDKKKKEGRELFAQYYEAMWW